MLTLIFTLLFSSGTLPDKQRVPKSQFTCLRIGMPRQKPLPLGTNRDRVKIHPGYRDWEVGCMAERLKAAVCKTVKSGVRITLHPLKIKLCTQEKRKSSFVALWVRKLKP